HSGRPGGAHAYGIWHHGTADDAELGDQLAQLTAVFGGQGNFGGGQGGAGAELQVVAGEQGEGFALVGQGAEGFELVAALAVKDELGGEGAGAGVGDAAWLT